MPCMSHKAGYDGHWTIRKYLNLCHYHLSVEALDDTTRKKDPQNKSPWSQAYYYLSNRQISHLDLTLTDSTATTKHKHVDFSNCILQIKVCSIWKCVNSWKYVYGNQFYDPHSLGYFVITLFYLRSTTTLPLY